MQKSVLQICAILGVFLIPLSVNASADSMKMMSPAVKASATSTADKKLIASAMAAVPASVARDATVIVMGADGAVRTLRKGSGSFTCMPDDPTTPGPDPMCMDKNGLDWVMALAGHKTPAAGRVGFIYMLAGGTDASNTDPYATKPDSKNHWIKTGPHVMVVGADASYYDNYPKAADPDTSVPYVMWAGTPYQHTMVPVR